MIFVNFKIYEKGTGQSALDLIKILEKVSIETQVKVIPVVQASDVREVCGVTSLEVWVQHVDPVEFGAHTGFILPEAVSEDGAKGTFLNHSEHKFLDFEDLKKAHDRAKSVGLKTLIFSANLEELKRVVTLRPDFVSYEPPELVGSKTTSVASAHPDIIAKAYDVAKENNIPLIVGAGVHSKEDVIKSLQLGAVGIAVATDIVKAENPELELLDLINGFKQL